MPTEEEWKALYEETPVEYWEERCKEEQAVSADLRRNLAMHTTPILCVIDGWPRCQEAIELVQKAGIDVKIVKIGIDPTGEGLTPPYLVCDCPGGSGIKRIRELVQRAVPFVHTGGH